MQDGIIEVKAQDSALMRQPNVLARKSRAHGSPLTLHAPAQASHRLAYFLQISMKASATRLSLNPTADELGSSRASDSRRSDCWAWKTGGKSAQSHQDKSVGKLTL